jgi:hypothetical protein
LLSGGDINIYSLFVERAQALIRPAGMVGLLVPSGIAADKGASEFFGGIATSGRLAALLDFENRRSRFGLEPFFPDVDTRFKFCVFVTGGKERAIQQAVCAFYLQDVSEILDPERCFSLSADDFRRVNPNTKTAPILRTRRDAQIVRGVYGRLPVLDDHSRGDKKQVWPVRYFTMFHMTNDARLFRTRAELESEGVYPVEGGRLRKGSREYVPLVVGKTINQFDHRAASVAVNPGALHVAASSEVTTEKQHTDPNFFPTPQYWVASTELRWESPLRWCLAFRDITNTTNRRTMIAALVPESAFGNKAPIIFPNSERESPKNLPVMFALMVANLNAFVLDRIARTKTQGTNLNWYIVEQLPVVPPTMYESKIGNRKIADLVCEEVLRLTFTAHDMQPFAEDMGYEGEPFVWDEEDRRHRRARLDAIYFRLYGLGEDDAAYVLDTFPIVREEDERAFGRYRTKEMILAYMRDFAASDTTSRMAV